MIIKKTYIQTTQKSGMQQQQSRKKKNSFKIEKKQEPYIEPSFLNLFNSKILFFEEKKIYTKHITNIYCSSNFRLQVLKRN